MNIFRHLKSGTAGGIFPLLLLSVWALNACGPETPQAVHASVLNRGTGDEPESLDMQKASSTGAGEVQRDIGEGLLGFTPSGELHAAAAQRWTISDDGREYTFWLRPEAHWSNGDPVTAEDFVYSFRRLVNPTTAALYVKSVDAVENANEIMAGQLMPDALGVSAVGEHELRIRLEHAVPYFLSLLTHPSTFPVHRGSVEQHGDAHARAGNHVSNGAYTLREWQLGSHIELSRNEHYWNNAETAIDRVFHYVSPEPMSELNRFRAGELHVTHTIPPELFRQMQEERPEEVRISPALGVYYYGFNMTKPVFADNPKLREALSMAIDRETIANDIVGRGELPAYGWVPDGTADYDPQRFSWSDILKDARHDRARQIFQEAGYGDHNPLTIELLYNTSNIHQRIAAAVQAMWKDVLGVETTLVKEEFQVMLENIQHKDATEVFRLTWSGDYNDAHAFLSMFESDNPSNLMAYQSAEYDSLMKRAAEQTDPGHRLRFLEEAERVLLRDHPVVPLYFHVSKSMVSKQVRGWGDNVLNYHYSQHLSLATEE